MALSDGARRIVYVSRARLSLSENELDAEGLGGRAPVMEEYGNGDGCAYGLGEAEK